MADIHKLLDETEKNIRELVDEIEKFKNARALNEKVTNSLVAMRQALDETVEKIKPFRSVEFRKVVYIFFGVSLANTLLLAAILILTIIKQ